AEATPFHDESREGRLRRDRMLEQQARHAFEHGDQLRIGGMDDQAWKPRIAFARSPIRPSRPLAHRTRTSIETVPPSRPFTWTCDSPWYRLPATNGVRASSSMAMVADWDGPSMNPAGVRISWGYLGSVSSKNLTGTANAGSPAVRRNVGSEK